MASISNDFHLDSAKSEGTITNKKKDAKCWREWMQHTNEYYESFCQQD